MNIFLLLDVLPADAAMNKKVFVPGNHEVIYFAIKLRGLLRNKPALKFDGWII
jgi:hypothetical protein